MGGIMKINVEKTKVVATRVMLSFSFWDFKRKKDGDAIVELAVF
jgi:hypothetical protein